MHSQKQALVLDQCADAVFDVSEKKSYMCLREGGGVNLKRFTMNLIRFTDGLYPNMRAWVGVSNFGEYFLARSI